MEVKVYNQEGKEAGLVKLSDAIFGIKWNADLVHQVVNSMVANQRQTVAKTKDRAEVRGGGKKPWRQKGTGRARHGSIRSPIWKGGGVTHGPLTAKNYKKKINKTMAKAALKVVLSAKVRDNELIVVDDMSFAEPKTKLAAKVFENLSKIKEYANLKKGNGVLVALPAGEAVTKRALYNLPFVGVEEARNLNAYELLQYRYVLFPKNVAESLSKEKSQ